MLASILVGAIILAFLCNTVYSVLFHPLKDYPGPRLAAASRLLYSLKVFQGRHKYFIKSLHDQYGLVVRIAPNELSYIDPRAYDDIYGRLAHEKGSAGLAKEPDFFGPIFNDSNTIVDASSDGVKAQKKNAIRAFSHGSLLSRGQVFASCTDRTIEALKTFLDERKSSSPIAIDPWMGNLVLDTHGQLTMSQDLGAVAMGPALHPIVSRMHAAAITLQYTTQLQYLPGVLSLVTKLLPKLDLFSVLGGFPPLGPALTARLASKQNPELDQDFVSHMLQGSEGYAPDLGNVRNNSTIFTLSAVQVMPGYICSVLYFLLATPEYYRQASKEVRDSAQDQDVTIGLTQSMDFLSACMREALRLRPPFLGTLPRRVPEGGATVCGQFVPGDATVGIHNWSITHTEEFWKDPDQFRPERWLNDERYKDDRRAAFNPFGVGPRTCVARHLALLEATFIVAKLLSAFDMTLHHADCGNWATDQGGHAVPTMGCLRIGMRARTKEG